MSSTLFLVSKFQSLIALLTRLSVGFIFTQSGWGKFHNLDKVTEFFASLHIPAPHLQAPFVAGVELVCGILLMVGLLSRVVSIPLIFTMVVALSTAKSADISSASDLFQLSEFLYILLLAWIVTAGPGAISLDRIFFRPKPAEQLPRSLQAGALWP